jgi:hypothetical protein
MPKRRTTGCKQEHDGGRCRDCNRIRVRRARALAGRRPDPPTRLALTAAQRQANAAAAYVRKYLKRDAIAPPDACERCHVPVQASPSWPLRPLRFFHPDPARPRLVAWLCADCRRRVRASGEPLTLSWTWPGITAPRSRKPPDLPQHVAAAVAALDARLPAGRASPLRDAALVRLLVRALAPGERERLYAAGALAGPRWRPTADPYLDALLREWAFTERAERGAAARAAGGTVMTPLLPAEPRRQRRGAPPSPPPAPAPAPPPSDPKAAWVALHRAAEQLAAAEAAALETNARVTRAVRDRFG